MKMILITLACAGLACAQNPFSTDTMGLYKMTFGNLMKTAEKIPADMYSFAPTPEVKTVAGFLGHIADAQYSFCSAAKGEARPQIQVEKTTKTKEELVGALGKAMEYCMGAYSSLTDASAVEKVKFFGSERTRGNVLNFNIVHNYEHYGNLVTYMRIKGIVPPSSEPRK
ncbi:MAG: DinB family protein [Bryobacter sp.]|jgi:uncharacterized damage-inducible protein DinB|nr:DinB family protein [Bryobacter sp.]